MVLDAYRHVADAILDPMARGLRSVSPDALSWTALGFAAAAGVALYRGGATLLLLGTLFVFLNALFDALDGKVAKLTGRASRRGDFLDHVLDRYADVLILGGIALSGYCPLWLGLLALLGVLLTSYMGTQAQAVGIGRQYGGARPGGPPRNRGGRRGAAGGRGPAGAEPLRARPAPAHVPRVGDGPVRGPGPRHGDPARGRDVAAPDLAHQGFRL